MQMFKQVKESMGVFAMCQSHVHFCGLAIAVRSVSGYMKYVFLISEVNTPLSSCA